MVETFQKQHLEFAGVGAQLYWAGGVILLGGFENVLPNWRHLQLLISLSVIASVAYVWYTHATILGGLDSNHQGGLSSNHSCLVRANRESLRWLYINQRFNEAADVTHYMLHFNRKKPTKKIADCADYLALWYQKEHEDEEKSVNSFVTLFSSPQLRRRVLGMSYIWFTASIWYYAISFAITDFIGSKYINLAVAGVTCRLYVHCQEQQLHDGFSSLIEKMHTNPSLAPVFLEINRKNFPQYVDHIKNTLQRSSVVSFAVHSTVCPDSARWRAGESLQEHYLRLAKFSLNHSIFGLGISCLEYHPADEDPTKSSSMAVRNFNLTLGTAAASEMSPQDGRRMQQMGYDLNYVTREAVFNYRRKEDVAPNHLEESKMLRDIFIALHGNSSHPVVVKDGFLDILMAYTALSGLAGDGADEYLQRLFYLFPGKIIDLGVSVKESSRTISDAQFAFPLEGLVFPLEGLDSLDVFSFVESGGVDVKARDLSKTSLSTAVASYGNLLLSVAAPQPAQLQLLPGSKFRPTKKRKTEFDFTVPLTASSNDAGISSSSDPLKPI
ncbi:hypothetical protein BV898_09908 [Hypsibius exemplaris]|uniref:Uncharacterized protein n=1 Tax=Hypsibius exemplaris TaxID=2072580 RepID=A0A1W0WLE8_HYPEX|nr:hypothetical protein BV898_09908 [Hypsibius exemplaris]